MIRWVILSMLLHVLLAFVGWRHSGRPVFDKRKVIQVALIRLSQPPKESAVKTVSTPEPVIREEPKPVAVKKVSKPKKSLPVAREKPQPEPKDPVKAKESGPQVQVEGVTFPFNYYLELLHKRIQENWNPPFQREPEGKSITAVVVFRIERDGRIGDIRLEKKAGNFVYDQAVKRTIFNLGKLPPLPPEFEGEFLNLHVEFETL